MFLKHSSDGFVSPVEGIEMKTLVYGEKSLLARFHLAKGSELPIHSHPHEQTGFLISGKMTLYIDQEPFPVEPGDSWSIPGDVEHRVDVMEDSVAIEVFSPIRKDYLPEENL